jgi:hypothetical protein
MSAQPENVGALSIPDLAPDVDVLTAALAYATSGWYVGPCKRGTKHPGSVLGSKWQTQTSRDPQQIVAWFAGSDDGVFLHAGRSGAVILDDDAPERVPVEWRPLLAAAPFQGTRESDIARGHHVFAMPPGRSIGSPDWAAGEVRGKNGVIIVAPSVHEKAAEGGRYRWLRGGVVPVLPPVIAATLPDSGESSDAASDVTISSFYASCVRDDFPAFVKAPLDGFRRSVAGGRGRHSSAIDAACWIAREASAGAYPAAAALDTLGALFAGTFTADERGRRSLPRGGRGEFGGIVAWAVGQLTAERIAQTRAELERKAGVDRFVFDLSGGALPPGGPGAPVAEVGLLAPNLPEHVWERGVLAKVRKAAWSRLVSPDAVLGALLARLSSILPPSVRVDTGLGSASLNTMVALIGNSGAGKSRAHSCARELLPVPLGLTDYSYADALPLGTGEGMAEAFYGYELRETGETLKNGDPKTARMHVKVRDNASFYLDEGESLSRMMERSGATIGQVLRSAWSGEALGQANASAETRRVVPAGSYSLGLVIAYQRSTVGPLLADGGGGTPQRFLFVSAEAEPPEQDVLDWPGYLENVGLMVPRVEIGLPQVARDEMRAARREGMRPGAPDRGLDTHALLHQAKLAALLALLELRYDATEADWTLAGDLWTTSSVIRDGLVEEYAQRARAEAQAREDAAVRARARGNVAGSLRAADALEDRQAQQLERVVEWVVDKVRCGTHAVRGRTGLKVQVAGRDRGVLEAAVREAVERGLLADDGGVLTLIE